MDSSAPAACDDDSSQPISTAEAVLDVVSRIPPGKVVSYGDVAEFVGTSARRVGTVMAQIGGEVPWWRVTNARGALPPRLLPEARRRWQEEGIGVHSDQSRCLIHDHRALLADLE